MALYDKLEEVPRHDRVLTVRQEEIEKREFGRWSMSFQDISRVDPDRLDSYTDSLEQPFTGDYLVANPSKSYEKNAQTLCRDAI